MKQLIVLIALFTLVSCDSEPFKKRELSKFKGAEVLDKDTFWHCLTLKMPDGDIIHTGWYPKDEHYKPTDTIK